MKHGTCVKDVLIYFWFSLFVPVEWLNKQTTEIVLRYLTLCLILGTFFSRMPTANLAACQIEFLKSSGPSNSVTKHHVFLHSVIHDIRDSKLYNPCIYPVYINVQVA